MHFDERDATLRYNICAELIRKSQGLTAAEIITQAETIYEFVTRVTGNSPALKKVDDEIPF